MVLHWKRQEAENTRLGILLMLITLMRVFLANTLNQAESLLHSLNKAGCGLGLHKNVDKMEYIFFNQSSHICSLNYGSLKLVNRVTYFGRCNSSTENEINTRLAKAWTAFDRLSDIWKSDLSTSSLKQQS